jgi:hypothetical protein
MEIFNPRVMKMHFVVIKKAENVILLALILINVYAKRAFWDTNVNMVLRNIF